jgi:O-antigen/teichoic acid export membrane protein
LAISDDESKKYRIFQISNFVGFIIYGFIALILYFIFNPFITIWVGREYIFNNLIVLIIVSNFFLTGMSYPLISFKTAAGVYTQDKYIPLAQAIVNLIISIILVKHMGIMGVLLGTFISILVLPIWNKPYIVYKYVFNRSVKEYFFKYSKYIFVVLLDGSLLNILFKYMALRASLINIIFMGIIIFFVFILTTILLFRNDNEFKFIISSLSKFWSRIWKKN